MNTTFTVTVNDKTVHEGDDLETAIRSWDAATYLVQPGGYAGGIAVATFDADVQVREGWILHVRENGTVYLNPNLQEATA